MEKIYNGILVKVSGDQIVLRIKRGVISVVIFTGIFGVFLYYIGYPWISFIVLLIALLEIFGYTEININKKQNTISKVYGVFGISLLPSYKVKITDDLKIAFWERNPEHGDFGGIKQFMVEVQSKKVNFEILNNYGEEPTKRLLSFLKKNLHDIHLDANI